MPVIEKNYSYFLNGTSRPGAQEDPTILSDIVRDAKEPGEGRIQTLSELWDVIKNVKAPHLVSSEPAGK